MYDQLAGEDAIYAAQGVWVTSWAVGSWRGVPLGARGSVLLGAFAVTPRGVIASIGRIRLVDVAFEPRSSGPLTLTLDRAGMRIRTTPQTGSLKLRGQINFRRQITEAELASFPAVEIALPAEGKLAERFYIQILGDESSATP